ncbi:hypothetical protein B0I37DRAFT_150843 [Chaetomium sp. MPI-CAGE-AT-0009]|nr:hypothetical protein B0I37DRAFT_150843 [Chaetomium sp. MPI-CAGE-AT-0009]
MVPWGPHVALDNNNSTAHLCQASTWSTDPERRLPDHDVVGTCQAIAVLAKPPPQRPTKLGNVGYGCAAAGLTADQVCLLISLVLIIVATRHGYGQHLADLKSNPAEAFKLIALSEFFAIGASAVAKTAIAITLLKVLDVRWQRMVTWGLVISVNLIIWGFATFLSVIIWQDRLVEICVEAIGVWRFAMFGAVWSALTDFAFAIIPWPFVCHLHRRTTQKISLGVAMSFGLVSGAIAIVKITQMDCKNFQQDATHDTVALAIWIFAEPVAIIVAASIPLLRHLIEKPAQAAFERGIMGARGGSGLPHNLSLPPSARFGQRAKIWSSRSGPVGTFIALQTLGSADAILRTDEVQVKVEENSGAHPQDNNSRHHQQSQRT